MTLARGVEPVDLDPDIDGVARVGRAGDWSFAVEYGDAAGYTEAGLRAVSRDGAEAISFLMTPWNPPSMFAYYKDGIHVCSFGIGERRWGRDDLLVPALEKVGVLPWRQACGAYRQRGQRLSMLAIEEHFGLRLRKRDIVVGRLPLYRVREW